jgi:general stress protein CsbA
MVQRLRYPLIWLTIVAVAGLIARYAFNASFWIGAAIAAFSLVVNGLVIEWEDRQKGGWSQ